MGLGPQLSALLRSVVPATNLVESMRTTELDVLKFVRSIIDQRIASLSDTPPKATFTRVTIE